MKKFLTLISLAGFLFASQGAMAGMTSAIVTINFVEATAAPVPLLSAPMLIVMSLLLLVVGYRMFRHSDYSRLASFMVVGLALATASIGSFNLIDEAHATGTYLVLEDNGSKSSSPVYNGGSFPVENQTGTPIKITNISLEAQGQGYACSQNTGGGSDPNTDIPDCVVGGVVNTVGNERGQRSCEVRVSCFVPSDARLKEDISHLITLENGLSIYSFRYNEESETFVGVMAQEVLGIPSLADAVIKMDSGFYAVNYDTLGLQMITIEQWLQSSGNIYNTNTLLTAKSNL